VGVIYFFLLAEETVVVGLFWAAPPMHLAAKKATAMATEQTKTAG
jgi:hypothetical protein